MHRRQLLGLLSLTLCCVPSPAEDREHFTAQEMFEFLELTELEQGALLDGAILSAGQPELEQTKKELVVSSLMMIDVPLERVIQELRDEATLQVMDKIIFFEPIRDDSVFDLVEFSAAESKEAANLLKFQGGSDFNLGPSEVAVLRQLAKDLSGQSQTATREAVSAAYREMLRKRYHSYRQQGLDGIEPYLRKSDTVSPARELKLAAESMPVARQVFPDFQRSLIDYPRVGSEYLHRFFLIKKEQQGRPAFVLAHRILDVQPGYALMAEQQFFVGHTYNSLQIAMGWFPHGGKTFVGLITRTSTEKVAGFGGDFARKVGRSRVQQIVEPFFEELRDVLHGE